MCLCVRVNNKLIIAHIVSVCAAPGICSEGDASKVFFSLSNVVCYHVLAMLGINIISIHIPVSYNACHQSDSKYII